MVKFDAPLGIPQGSVRAILALVVIGGAVISLFVGSMSESDQTFIFGMAGVAFGYYFGARQSETIITPSTGEPITPSIGPDEPDNSESRIVPGSKIE